MRLVHLFATSRSYRSFNVPFHSISRSIRRYPQWRKVQYRMICLLNSLTQKIEPLPNQPFSWYSCGPTLYDHSHLGHARNYVTQDILYRIMTHYFQHDIHFVLGLTDVDDKIVKVAQERSAPFLQIARDFEQAFVQDLEQLNVLPPAAYVRVSEHIPDIITYVEQILLHGFAYVSSIDGSVYFDTLAFEHQYPAQYGKLDPDVNRPSSQIHSISKHEIKKNSRDFALWKTASDLDSTVGWTSPWGFGRPGWHIECSAMCHRMFGRTLDLHSGGIDLKFPHHNNEIAQCEAYNHNRDPEIPNTWCNHFLHFGHLYIKGLKMSKSLKNFITIQEFLQTYSADQFRLFCLQHHYRSDLHYSSDRMDEAKAVGMKFESFFNDLLGYSRENQFNYQHRVKSWTTCEFHLHEKLSECKVSVNQALENDANTPLALHELVKLMSATNVYLQTQRDPAEIRMDLVKSVGAYIARMLDLFGIVSLIPEGMMNAMKNSSHVQQTDDNNAITDLLVEFRAKVRHEALISKNNILLQKCDDIRKILMDQHSIQIDDITTQQSIWKRGTMTTTSNDDLNKVQETTIGAIDENSIKTIKGDSHLLPLDQTIAIPSSELFQLHPAYCGNYSQFDSQGVPTHDATGQELTKTARKKLKKKMD